jgi:RNA polymerase sigma-70 factor (ECF subfamily)
VDRIDGQRLRQLLDAHGAALALYARQWCRAPDDAVQEALVELLRQDPAPDHPAAWLFKTVRRRAMNQARSERRRAEHHRRAGEHRAEWFLEDDQSEFDSIELARMLESLPPLEREIVVARVWGGLPFERIAELVAVSVSAAHRRYHRALALLGDMMDEKSEKAGPNNEQPVRTTGRRDA